MYASINLFSVQTTSLILSTMQYFHQQKLSQKIVKTPRQHSTLKLPPASTNIRSNDSVLLMFITTNDVDESECKR